MLVFCVTIKVAEKHITHGTYLEHIMDPTFVPIILFQNTENSLTAICRLRSCIADDAWTPAHITHVVIVQEIIRTISCVIGHTLVPVICNLAICRRSAAS